MSRQRAVRSIGNGKNVPLLGCEHAQGDVKLNIAQHRGEKLHTAIAV